MDACVNEDAFDHFGMPAFASPLGWDFHPGKELANLTQTHALLSEVQDGSDYATLRKMRFRLTLTDLGSELGDGGIAMVMTRLANGD